MNARYPRSGGLPGDAGLVDGLLGLAALLERAHDAIERAAARAGAGDGAEGADPLIEVLLGTLALGHALDAGLGGAGLGGAVPDSSDTEAHVASTLDPRALLR